MHLGDIEEDIVLTSNGEVGVSPSTASRFKYDDILYFSFMEIFAKVFLKTAITFLSYF